MLNNKVNFDADKIKNINDKINISNKINDILNDINVNINKDDSEQRYIIKCCCDC